MTRINAENTTTDTPGGIPRDRYGRPLIQPLDRRKKREPYQRVTNFIAALEDKEHLIHWRGRKVAQGMAARPNLIQDAANIVDPDSDDGKKALGRISREAAAAAGIHDAANVGTALHHFTELIDRGQPWAGKVFEGVHANDYAADLEAYTHATEHIEWLAIESFRVHDGFKVAGTPDRIGRNRNGGTPKIGDIKTGKLYPHKVAMQMAMYSRMVPYDVETDTRGEVEENLDQNTAIVIHLPVGEGRCDLYEINIAKGWGACMMAAQVKSWRSTKDLMHKVGDDRTNTWTRSNSPKAPPTWESLIADACTVPELRTIWETAGSQGQLTDNLKHQLTKRSTQISH